MTELINPTDKELDLAFAEYVSDSVPCDHWRPFMGDSMMNDLNVCGHANCYPRQMPIKYCKYADAVLPYLEKCKTIGLWIRIYDQTNGLGCGRRDWLVSISNRDEADDYFEGKGWKFWEGVAPTFARAAVIALLQANNVRVTFDNESWNPPAKVILKKQEENAVKILMEKQSSPTPSKLFQRKKFKKRL